MYGVGARMVFGARGKTAVNVLSTGLLMGVQETISRKLTEAFAPLSLKVLDESDRHEGHAGHRPGGETHFRIYIVADAFRGKSRLARHRMINETLAGEFKSGVHALAIHAAAPDETF